jgi:C_GCAxxG_C_C family probable redox protein
MEHRISMKRSDEAVACFKKGFSCSQAVCSTYSRELGLDEQTALKISCGLGGGLGHTNGTCGALTGAALVIGLKYGKVTAGDNAAKETTYAKVNHLVDEFRRRNGSVACTDLVGYNLSLPEEFAKAKEKKAAATRCPKFIQDAAEILEECLKD